MKPGLLVTTILFVFSSSMAMGAEQAQTGGPRTACKADVEKLCAGVQNGGGRIAGCLKQNEARLSPACRARRAAAAPKFRGYVEEFAGACWRDIGRLCAGVKPGRYRWRICSCLRAWLIRKLRPAAGSRWNG